MTNSSPPDWDGTPPEQNPLAIPVDENTVRRIPLTRGYVALVDADKYGALVQIPWYAKVSKRWKRVDAVTVGHPRVQMHRLIKNAPDGVFVDHFNARGGLMADGVTLDNRDCNLSLVTNAQNQYNVGLSESNTTGFKGVVQCAESRSLHRGGRSPHVLHRRLGKSHAHIGPERLGGQVFRTAGSTARSILIESEER